MKKVAQVATITTAIITGLMSNSAFAIDFSLFGDVAYSSTSEEDVDNKSFTLGQFALIAQEEIGESTSVTAEIVFEDAGQGFEVDVERFSISKTINPLFTIGMGRFHTHLGFWNQNFHHGSLIQDTITRPFFLEFEDTHGGIFPNHIIGFQVSGESEQWSYQLSLSNSNGLDTSLADGNSDTALQVMNSTDPNEDKSTVFRLAYKPKTFLDEIGFSAMTNHVVEVGENDGTNSPFVNFGETLFEQQIIGVDLRLATEKFYVLAEFFQTSIDDNQLINASVANPAITSNPKTYDSTAYYAQFGYHLTSRLTAVGRFESLDYDNNSTYFKTLNVLTEERVIFAINYKLQESNAMRIQVSEADLEGGKSNTAYSLQWFFLLF